MSAHDDVLKVVDQYWRSVQQIHELVDCWALPTVRQALIKLENHKSIISNILQSGNKSRKVYRLAAVTAALSLVIDDANNNRSPRLDSNQVQP